MTTKKIAEAAPKGKDPHSYDDAVLDDAYARGRMAQRQSISKEDAPFDSESDEYKAWVKGWDYEDKL
jgi:hypothetical protein